MNRRQFLKALGIGAAVASFDIGKAAKILASYIPKPIKTLAVKNSFYSEYYIKPAAQALANSIDRDIMDLYLKEKGAIK